jgi:hypothetical protein
LFTTTKQIVQLERDSLRQVKNSRRLRFDKCINPKIDKNKSIINFTYDGKNRAITGQPNQLSIVLKRMKNEISVEDFEKAINSNS